jgi:sugar O-acyltransferase (sialic acid O-acetyltransferase NeuD family)
MKPAVPLVIIGGGGHAAVLADTIELLGGTGRGYVDLQPAAGLDWPYLGDDEAFLQTDPQEVELVNGLGSVGTIGLRVELYARYCGRGFRFASLIHPAAVLSRKQVKSGKGLQVLAGAVVNTGASLGENVLINTRAVVEHDCRVGDHCHVATAAVLCGGVELGERVHIGANATVNQGVRIGDGAVVASGAVVIADVPAGALVAGVPAVLKRQLTKS